MLLKLEGFQYATSLDLNMGYYHILLIPFSKSLCTIVTPWGKYKYQRLPMGLCNSPDIFQEFGPKIKYIKGPKNIVANALSRLDILDQNELSTIDCYGLEKDDLPEDAFPITYYLLNREQQKDKSLLERAQTHRHFSLKVFYGGKKST